METRKVQKLGYSSLVVSLPKKWADQIGLKPGDSVFIKIDNGGLRVLPSMDTTLEREKRRRYVVNTDMIYDEGIIERVLTGNYILGHDTVQFISQKGRVQPKHMDEIRRVVNRINGVGIVEQSLKLVTVQSFIDPTKFPVRGLMQRIYVILTSMLDTVIRGAVEGDYNMIQEVNHMENEVDRLYWLIIRQLLLSQRNREIAKAVGIDSILHIVGNRTIAKYLEEMGDRVEEMANELMETRDKNLSQYLDILKEIEAFKDKIKEILDNSMEALFSLDVNVANTVIKKGEEVKSQAKTIDKKIFERVSDPLLASILKLIITNLLQITKHLGSIAEITINRNLEEPSKLCEWKE